MEWALIYFTLLNVNYFLIRFLRSNGRSLAGFAALLSLDIVFFVFLRTDMNPFGLSFVFFMMLGLMVDEWRKQSVEPYKWQEFILMPIFFPLLMSGPLERGRHFFSSLKPDRSRIFSQVNDGITLIALGLLKNMFLLPRLAEMTNHFVHLPMTVGSMVITGVLETFKVYIELSSYADIGRGIAKFFGIDVFVNWRPFYMAKNPNDFWARWNVTLGTWIRDYFSFPVMLKFGRKLNQNVLLFISFILVGLWHSIDLIWLKFGIFNGVVVVLYNILSRWIRFGFFGRIFAFIIIVGNGVILRSADLPPKFFELFTTNFNYHTGMIDQFPFFIAALGLIFFLEIVEEIKGDHDWYFKAPLWSRTVFNIILVCIFLWMLDMEIFDRAEKMNQLPIYFKI
jgi:D-alanyl-lipoteichoic acid acyltransferase DltB (MBOAT superfamily)